MKYIFIILSLMLLGGCQTTTPMNTLIPVAIKIHNPNIPDKPDYPIYSLTISSTDQDIARAYAASFSSCNNYNGVLEAILEGYKHE